MSAVNTAESPAAHALAGGLGGVVAMGITYPMVTLSTLAQTKSDKTQEKPQEEPQEKPQAGQAQPQHAEDSLLRSIRNLYRKEGVLGFYSGFESAMYGMFLSNLVYYYFYELTTNQILKLRGKKQAGLTALESMLTGWIAGSATVLATNPIWVANTRMTVSGAGRTSTLRTLIRIIKTEGVGALLAGVLPALILVVNPIIQYTIFEQLKNLLNGRSRKGMSSIDAFFIGAIGKLVATGSTYPYITVKSRMHLNRDKHRKSVLGWFLDIYKHEGVAGFYNGIGVKLGQSVLTAAFLFFFKEELLATSVRLLRVLKAKKV